MDSYDELDTRKWTPGFVRANRDRCLEVLRMYVSTATDFMQEKKYRSAVRCMKDISLGLIKMENEHLGDFDKQLILLALMMPATAIFGILEVDAPESSRKEAALQYAMELAAEDPNHELASCLPLAKEDVLHYIIDLRSDATPEQIKRKYDLPADLFNSLGSLDRDLAGAAASSASSSFSYAPSGSSYTPSASSYAPSASSYAPSASSYAPARSSPAPSRSAGRTAVVLLLAVIAGVLFFRARPADKPEAGASPVSEQQAKLSPEDAPEPLPGDASDSLTEDIPGLDPSFGFIFPDSDKEQLSQQEVERLSDSELSYAINELYARHGYIFRASEIREHFEQFSWYTPEIPADEFSTATSFNQTEKYNLNLLVYERDSRPDYENESETWVYATLASSGDKSVEALVLRELTDNGGWSKYFDGTNSDVWLKEYPTKSSRVRQTAKIRTGRDFEQFIADNANSYLPRADGSDQNMTIYDMAIEAYSQSVSDRMHSELDWLGDHPVLDSAVQEINGNLWHVFSGHNSGNGTQDHFCIFFFIDEDQEISVEVSFEYVLYKGASPADADLFNEWYLNLSGSLLIR